MEKLCRLLAIFSLLVVAGSCRLNEATQTVVEVKPDTAMRELVAKVQVQAYGLPLGTVAIDEGPMQAVWPVRRTFVPDSASASHRFRMVFSAFDAADAPIANFTLEADIVEGETRYVSLRLGDMCRPSSCDDGICQALVDVEDQANSRQEAFCGGRSPEPGSAATTGDSGDMTLTGMPSASGAGGESGSMDAGPEAPSNTPGAAANGGVGTQTSGQAKQDAGMTAPPLPASTEGECAAKPCGANGYCGLKADAPNKYVCMCDRGYEFDETRCVLRDDCKKNNGGCEDKCETVAGTGEAHCTCEGNTWLKGDGKQCTALQPEATLSLGSGSTQRTRPQVAFDSAGNGVVAWTEVSDSGTHTMWNARYSAATKSWQKPTRPFWSSTPNAADLHLVLDANGAGLLVWTATVDSHRQLWSARYRDNAFAAPRRIDDANGSEVLMPAIALDSAGDGLVAWTDFAWPMSSLHAARYYASSDDFMTMGTGVSSASNSLVFNTSVALHSIDSGLIAWTDVPVSMPDGGVAIDFLNSSAFNAKVGADLGQGVGFGDSRASATSPDVAMDADGRGVAVWLRANDAANDRYSVLSGVYVQGQGWNTTVPDTLAADVNVRSAPHIAVGADGSALAVWREAIGSDAAAQSMTRGALRVGNAYELAHDLGLPSDPALWNDVDTTNWTVESTVAALEVINEPTWDLAVGPAQTGYVVGAAYNTSSMPTQRQLWLQHVAAAQEPAEPIRFTAADSVPLHPSAPRVGINANGDGAVVWDRQVDGHYKVYVSLLQ